MNVEWVFRFHRGLLAGMLGILLIQAAPAAFATGKAPQFGPYCKAIHKSAKPVYSNKGWQCQWEVSVGHLSNLFGVMRLETETSNINIQNVCYKQQGTQAVHYHGSRKTPHCGPEQAAVQRPAPAPAPNFPASFDMCNINSDGDVIVVAVQYLNEDQTEGWIWLEAGECIRKDATGNQGVVVYARSEYREWTGQTPICVDPTRNFTMGEYYACKRKGGETVYGTWIDFKTGVKGVEFDDANKPRFF